MKKYLFSLWESPQRMQRWTRSLLLGAMVLAAFLVMRWVVSLWPVRVVVLSGELRHINMEDVRGPLLHEIRGQYLLQVPIEELRESLQGVPWVRQVDIRRHWPDALLVDIQEHQAQARWGKEGRSLVGADGSVYQIGRSSSAMARLPLFVGPSSDKAAEMLDRWREWNGLLAPLGKPIVQVELSPRLSWRMRIASGDVIELGRASDDNPIQPRLQRLVRSLQTLNLGGGQWNFDLRYPNGFALRRLDKSNNET